MGHALLMAFVYWLFENIFDLFTVNCKRPILYGTLAGIFCGDITTGIIIGCTFEAIYMGVVAIGGSRASNTGAATIFGVAMAVWSSADIETSMALAVVVGTVINSLKPINDSIQIALHPIFVKLAEQGKIRQFRIAQWAQNLLVKNLVACLAIFLVVWLGGEAVDAWIEYIPDFILNGLKAASNMLVVVELGLTTQALWGKGCILWTLLGFVLFQFVGLDVLPIAIIGVIIAFFMVQLELRFKAIEDNTAAANNNIEGGDDFYG